MENLLRKICGLGEEDLTTEVLKYLLTSDTFNQFQHLFWGRVFSQFGVSIQMPTVVSQRAHSITKDRPDLIFFDEFNFGIIENKLGSSLSRENQVVAYGEILTDDTFVENFQKIDTGKIKRYLIVLCPESTFGDIENRTKAYLRCDNLVEFYKDKGVSYKSLFWEDIKLFLGRNDWLQIQLRNLIEAHTSERWTVEELGLLKNKVLGSAIKKLFERIENIRSNGDFGSFKPKRMSQSYNYYGFTLNFRSTDFWFGYGLPIWNRFECPIFIQIRKEWIREEKTREEIYFKLISSGMLKIEEEHGLVKIFSWDEVESWHITLKNFLTNVEKSLQGYEATNR